METIIRLGGSTDKFTQGKTYELRLGTFVTNDLGATSRPCLAYIDKNGNRMWSDNKTEEEEFDFNNLLLMIENDGTLYDKLSTYFSRRLEGFDYLDIGLMIDDVECIVIDFVEDNNIKLPNEKNIDFHRGIFGWWWLCFDFEWMSKVRYMQKSLNEAKKLENRAKVVTTVRQCASEYLRDNKPKQEESKMKTHIIKVESKVFIDGVEGSEMSDDAILSAIAKAEDNISEIKNIKSKSVKIKQKIVDMEKGLADLVKYFDNK